MDVYLSLCRFFFHFFFFGVLWMPPKAERYVNVLCYCFRMRIWTNEIQQERKKNKYKIKYKTYLHFTLIANTIIMANTEYLLERLMFCSHQNEGQIVRFYIFCRAILPLVLLTDFIVLGKCSLLSKRNDAWKFNGILVFILCWSVAQHTLLCCISLFSSNKSLSFIATKQLRLWR